MLWELIPSWGCERIIYLTEDLLRVIWLGLCEDLRLAELELVLLAHDEGHLLVHLGLVLLGNFTLELAEGIHLLESVCWLLLEVEGVLRGDHRCVFLFLSNALKGTLSLHQCQSEGPLNL